MKNNQNSISVIIPVFNRAKLIYRSINSVINQTYPVNEIIVIEPINSFIFFITLYFNNGQYYYKSGVFFY